MSTLPVRHPLQRAHTLVVRLLLLCAVCLGLAACAPEGSTSTGSEPTDYSVALSVADRSLNFKVEVSAEVTDHYLEANGYGLDAQAVEDLVGESVRRAIASGSVELPDANAEQRIVLDISEMPVSPNALHTQGMEGGCLVPSVTYKYEYKWYISDSYGCRFYVMTDVYDTFRNVCGGGDQMIYIGTTTTGPWAC